MGVITLFHSMKGGGWGEAILGILAIIFGCALLANPLIGGAYLPYVLGIFPFIGGVHFL